MNHKSRLLIATHNPAKLREIKYFLKDLPIKLVALRDLNIKQDMEEDGKTFEENAVKKAKYYAKISNLPTLADDGGIEIDYLNGEPGVHSRRWIKGKRATDEELINHTLRLLKDVPEARRSAQLRTAMALILENGAIKVAEGKIRGIIAKKPYAKQRWEGFPFRSLFYIPEIGKYYNPGDMTKEEEIRYNHRGKALEKLKKIIFRKFVRL
jgi:XTP/dITP diphosphohydrolase